MCANSLHNPGALRGYDSRLKIYDDIKNRTLNPGIMRRRPGCYGIEFRGAHRTTQQFRRMIYAVIDDLVDIMPWSGCQDLIYRIYSASMSIVHHCLLFTWN